MSIVVLIDFIAILLTPGIFLLQIVNTNMYLIHFHSKNNIKMHFPKSWVFKISNPLQTFATLLNKLQLQSGEINCIDISKDFTTMCRILIFKKNNTKILYIYSSKIL